jgi:poly-gamma-glutamate capsule biosynthesis protein CapA/YwtB (metallophosphatase superfamily)
MGFVGDVCPLFGREAQFGADVRAFLADCDVVVGNFEGVFSDRFWQPFLMKHEPSIFGVLEQIAPLDRWVVSVANNHATDFGTEALRRTLEILDRRGLRWLGTAERPRLALADDVTLTAWTWWLNRPADGVARADPGSPDAPGLHVALPHWGYEHERRPRPSQSVPDGYDLTVGHHTHLPQPFEQTGDGRLVAWSLGNFVTGKQLPVLGEGALLKVGVARPGEEPPEIVRAQFREIDLDRDRHHCRVSFRQVAAPGSEEQTVAEGTSPAATVGL